MHRMSNLEANELQQQKSTLAVATEATIPKDSSKLNNRRSNDP